MHCDCRVHQLNFFWEYQKSSARICFPGVSGGPNFFFFLPQKPSSASSVLAVSFSITLTIIADASSYCNLGHTDKLGQDIWTGSKILKNMQKNDWQAGAPETRAHADRQLLLSTRLRYRRHSLLRKFMLVSLFMIPLRFLYIDQTEPYEKQLILT